MNETTIVIVGLIVFSLGGLLSIIYVPRAQLKSSKLTPDDPERRKLENELRRTVIQVVGGLGIIFGLFLTWRTLTFNEFAKNGERFTALVSNLNSDQPTLRYDAIYELAAIADQSPARRTEVTDFLCYWVREESKKTTKAPSARAVEFTAVLRFVVGVDAHFSTTDPRTDSIDLSYADLKNITLDQVNFSSVNLTGADLSGSKFSYADLRKANLSGAKVEGTTFIYAKTQGLIFDNQTSLRGCNLQGNDFQNFDFSNMRLDDVNFYDCKLRGAKFTSTRISGLGFQRVDLTGVDLQWTDLKQAIGIKRSQLTNAVTNVNTIMPAQFEAESTK